MSIHYSIYTILWNNIITQKLFYQDSKSCSPYKALSNDTYGCGLWNLISFCDSLKFSYGLYVTIFRYHFLFLITYRIIYKFAAHYTTNYKPLIKNTVQAFAKYIELNSLELVATSLNTLMNIFTLLSDIWAVRMISMATEARIIRYVCAWL